MEQSALVMSYLNLLDKFKHCFYGILQIKSSQQLVLHVCYF